MNQLIQRLISLHSKLNREIRRELNVHFPDGARIRSLKKQRLAIKDQLFKLVPDASEMRRLARHALRQPRPF